MASGQFGLLHLALFFETTFIINYNVRNIAYQVYKSRPSHQTALRITCRIRHNRLTTLRTRGSMNDLYKMTHPLKKTYTIHSKNKIKKPLPNLNVEVFVGTPSRSK